MQLGLCRLMQQGSGKTGSGRGEGQLIQRPDLGSNLFSLMSVRQLSTMTPRSRSCCLQQRCRNLD